MQEHRTQMARLRAEKEALERRLEECELFAVRVSRAHGFRWPWTILGARWLRLAAQRLREEWGAEATEIAAALDKLAERE